MKIDLKLHHELLAVEAEHDVHAMIEITAPPPNVDVDRTPLSLALVLDRSGSMGGAPLETVKRCADYLVDQLQDDDELAIVTYDDAVDLVAPLVPLDRAQLHHAIAGIYAGGMTNLSGGWLKGREVLERADDSRIRRVLLLTDGQANVGLTDPAQLAGLAGQASATGVSTTTIGYGEAFNEHLLTRMADAGRGTARFAETIEDAPAIFADEFAGLVSMFAQNLSVEIRPSDAVEVVGVLNDHPMTSLPDGVQLMVGDVYSGQRSRVVFQLHVPQLAALGPVELATVVVRYVTVGDQILQHEVTYPLFANLVSADEAAQVSPDPTVTEEVTILLAAKATDEAHRLASEGDYDGARSTLRKAASEVRMVAENSDRAEDLLKSVEALDATDASLAANSFDAADAKRLYYNSRDMKRRK